MAAIVQAINGAGGLIAICVLLFAEEAGVPLPIAPGEAVLVGAGLLIASGGAPAWLVLPLCYVAVLGGALTGFAWARLIGPKRLRALAARIHATGPYDRAAERLRDATPLEIGVSRLLPGLRIYTTLVAGAVGLETRQFLYGVVPAIAVWVLLFTLLGVFAGAPVERLIGRVEAYGLRIFVYAGLAIIFFLLLRKQPVPLRRARYGTHPLRTGLALGVDAGLLALVVAVLSVLAGLASQEFDSIVVLAGAFGLLGLVYLYGARHSVGHTVGEALLEVRYRRQRAKPEG
jgi:membrane protein DedA with SNARE-associated domain